MSPVPLGVFMRAPSSSEVKTRLSVALDAAARARLYGAFVRDVAATCFGVSEARLELWVAGALDDPLVRSLDGAHRVSAQVGPDLGARMAGALEDMIAGAGRALIVGTDAPTLPPRILGAAVGALDRADVVLGPSADGGFYLVGVRDRVPSIFEGVRYSTRHALTDTVDAASAAGKSVALLSPWYDVDTPLDLALLSTHLSVDPEAAPQTAAVLL